MTESLVQQLVEKGKAGYPFIYLYSQEDQRVMGEIRQAAEQLKRKMYFWTHGPRGMVEDTPGARTKADSEGPYGALTCAKSLPKDAIIVLRQFHDVLPDPIVRGHLLDLIPEFKLSMKMLIILSPIIAIPPEVEKDISLLEAPMPDEPILNGILDGITRNLKEDQRPDEAKRVLLVKAARGLTTQEAENAFTLSVIRPKQKGLKKGDWWDHNIVIQEKCQSLRKTNILEYMSEEEIRGGLPGDGLSSIGGLENLKEWIAPLTRSFTEDAKTFGIAPPKGVLLVGLPGTGKSMFSKLVSLYLKMPLLRLDIGKIFSSLVGSSEANVRMAIRIAEAMSPCVLWTDEIEKGVSGASAGALDSGVSARVLQTLLTWMQEKKSPVFVVATANDVSMLPPELLRKGRFDEMFSLDLPTPKERREILDIHIRRRGRGKLLDDKTISLDHFSGETSKDFTGAEIDGALEQAMRVAFHNGRDLNSIDLQDAFDSTQPIAKTMQERITVLRNWCRARTRPASRAEAPVQVRVGTADRRMDA
jgi:ATP-dependent 26S proteasome regulatory subunit